MRRDAMSSRASSSRDDRASTSIDRRSVGTAVTNSTNSHPAPESRSGSRARDANAERATLATCSWCFHLTQHVVVGSRGVAMRCGACARRTTRCERFATCRAAARGGDGWDDARCLSCAGVVPKPWRACDPGEVERQLAPRGRCSWCGESARHRVTRAVGRRGTYLSHCSSCARATHKCERCADGFAKIGDGRCAACAGWVSDWDVDAETFARSTRVVAWCSWCGEKSAHVGRGVCGEANGDGVAGRDAVVAFECMVCGGGTTPCARCGDAGVMRKRSRPGGGGSCARCVVADERVKKINIGGYVSVPTIGALTKSLARAFTKKRDGGDAARRLDGETEDDEIARRWNVRIARRDAADEQASFIFDVLNRESEYRDKAYRAGLIRPFLLLATLPPRERARLGMRLGVTLCRSSSYLDPHAEAWKLLRDPACGLQTRGGNASKVVEKATGVGRGAHWIDILYATLTLGADSGTCPASDASEIDDLPKFRSSGHVMFALRVSAHPSLCAYELAALRLVSRAQRGRLAPAATMTLEGAYKHPRMEALKSRLRRAYAEDGDEVAKYAVTAAFASSSWATSTRALTPDDVADVADDVFGMLLDGTPLSRRGDYFASESPREETSEEIMSLGAPSLLGALAASTSVGFASYTAAQFAPTKFAVLTPRDIMDLTTGVRTPTLASSGVFEPVAVLLVHNVLLAARNVHVDDQLPREATRLSRDALVAAGSPSVALETPRRAGETSPESAAGTERDVSPWAPKYVHLKDDDAEARLEELEDAEESAAMLARYINALDTSDLYAGDEVLSSENLSSDDGE